MATPILMVHRMTVDLCIGTLWISFDIKTTIRWSNFITFKILILVKNFNPLKKQKKKWLT